MRPHHRFHHHTILVLSMLATLRSAARRRVRPVGQGERGQASAEYALVLLGAAAVAMLVSAWAARTGAVGRLLDAVIEHVIGNVT